ncbi:MAG TPA: cytochrome c biogenesis protein ResB [Mycobacteriales bacterium]|nr:cytochrome c biogenesis protein ResB [Mycobacteriales bacterium]
MTLTADPGLSTAPDPERPRATGGDVLAFVRNSWRQLTSMRTALLLLFLLALAAVPGAFLPQRGLNPVLVQEYYAENPVLAPWLDRLSLFDVYAAPWFAAIYLLLFVSLIGCIVPRTRLHLRALRTPPPPAPARLDRLPVSERWTTDDAPDAVLDDARRALKGWRTVRSGDAVSAERGYLRETGNLLFHVSLVALLAGVGLGGLFGFQGSVLVVEGKSFSSTAALYDDLEPGRRFSPEDLVPFGLTLEDFRATFSETGRPLTFAADITWTPDAGDPDAPREDYALRVNHPLSAGDARVYLIGHGYAPRLRVTDAAGEVAFDAPVPCLPQDVNFLSTCVVKVPDATGTQYGFEGVFTPTTVQDPETQRIGSIHPSPDLPGLTLVAYEGNLGLDAGGTQSVYRLEKARLTELDGGRPRLLEPGGTWQLPDGAVLEWVDTPEWVTLQVTQDPGKELALVASGGMVLGLLLSLFVRRRRVWVRAVPAAPGEGGGRTVVEVGGLGRTGADGLTTELTALAERLRGAPAPRDPGGDE